MVVFDHTEGCSHAAAHAGLFTVEDRVVPDNMGTHIFLVPPMPKYPEYNLNIMNVPIVVNISLVGGPYIMSCAPLLSKGYPGTF